MKIYIPKFFGTVALILMTIVLFAQSANVSNNQKISVMDGTSLFVQGNVLMYNDANVKLNGSFITQGDLINNVAVGNVFNSQSDGKFEFTGGKFQWIRGEAVRDSNYVNFPNVIINKNAAAVAIHYNMAADMNDLDIQRTKLILKVADTVDNNEVKTHNSFVPSKMAHLRVNNVAYNRTWGDPLQDAAIEIEILVSPTAHNTENRLFGFASPYKAMYADYFYDNYLSQPTANGLWGKDTVSILSPKTKLIAGTGYFSGQNILPSNRYTLDPVWGNPATLSPARVKDILLLNRYEMDATSNPLQTILTEADRYTIEEINTGDITINLKKGWQYIGNPYTSVLDMELFLQTIAGTGDAWAVTRTDNKSAGVDNRYYVMAGGTGSLDNWTPDRFVLNPTWLVGQKVGSTIAREFADNKHVIAPMQMFAVYANEDVSITIPASQRTHALSDTVQTATDELLIEVRDAANPYGGFDRTALVFRGSANTNATDVYDAPKKVDSLSSAGQIFTISGEGYAMITNIIPVVQKVELGMVPTLKLQNMILDAYRLSTLTLVTQMWLEDRKTGAAWHNLKSTPSYAFTSNPTDSIDRFVLHFNVQAGTSTPRQPLPNALFTNAGIPATTPIAPKSTGPVGSTVTDNEINAVGDTICEGTNGKVYIKPYSLQNVDYNVYDEYRNGMLKGTESGSGTLLAVNVGTSLDSESIYWTEAKSTDGLLTINRLLPVNFSVTPLPVVPDIRVQLCPAPGRLIYLSSYVDSVASEASIKWAKISSASPSVINTTTGEINTSGFIPPGTHSYKYVVENICASDSGKLYIKTIKDKVLGNLADTIAVCRATKAATHIQLNQILGLEVDGVWKYDNTVNPDNTVLNNVTKVASPSDYAGALMFNGLQAWEQATDPLYSINYHNDADAKQFKFTFTPSATSCLTDKSPRVLVIIVTSKIVE